MALYEKGQSGNLAGRPIGGSATANKIRSITNEELLSMVNLLVNGTFQELEEVEQDPNTPALQSWIAAVIVKGKKRGDMQALDTLLNRLVGKVKDRVEVSGELLSNEQVQRIVRLLKSDSEETSIRPALPGASNEGVIE